MDYPKIPDYYLIRPLQYPVKYALPWPKDSVDMDTMIPDRDDIEMIEAILTAISFYKVGASIEEAKRIYYLEDVDLDRYLLDFENLQKPLLPVLKLLPDNVWLLDKIMVVLQPNSGLLRNSDGVKVKARESIYTDLYGVAPDYIVTEDYPEIPLEYISQIECDLDETYKERVIRSLCA